jgi:hypothetical protein
MLPLDPLWLRDLPLGHANAGSASSHEGRSTKKGSESHGSAEGDTSGDESEDEHSSGGEESEDESSTDEEWETETNEDDEPLTDEEVEDFVLDVDFKERRKVRAVYRAGGEIEGLLPLFGNPDARQEYREERACECYRAPFPPSTKALPSCPSSHEMCEEGVCVCVGGGYLTLDGGAVARAIRELC